jgi:hypothetical protein
MAVQTFAETLGQKITVFSYKTRLTVCLRNLKFKGSEWCHPLAMSVEAKKKKKAKGFFSENSLDEPFV